MEGGSDRSCPTLGAAHVVGAGDSLNDQLVDDGSQSPRRREATVELLAVESNLAIRTRAARKNGARMTNLGNAVEIFCVLSDQLQKIVEQGSARDDLSMMQINETVLETIALCAPAVLVEEQERVIRQTLLLTLPP